ncbi:RNA polymerase [Glomus cerebriforme]|uniref:RNA polymerase n=1 Tax=Glomus cerebriforme TaxID=658196 RepID=A0A397TXV5_9GLOM|nr:RNA polymerase [Glomus cerebriforme]
MALPKAKNYILFNDTFAINDMDKEGKKFDRVSRFTGRGENLEMELTIDINTELCSLDIGDKVMLMLTTSLSLDTANIAQSEETILPFPIMAQDDQQEKPSWREKSHMERDLSDDFEYVMYGKVYKYDEEKRSKVAVYVSFGGLLMALEGDFRHVQNIHVGQNVYMLMKHQL